MNRPHWHYYISLVEDLNRLGRYIELSTDNYSTYSIELTRLFLATGSEVDVVAKLLCAEAEPSSNCQNINQYRDTLLPRYTGVCEVEVTMARYGLVFVPWKGWTDESPSWWRAYNNVKHSRNNFFRDACLKNTLDALSGLCVLICYLYHDFIANLRSDQRPSLFLDPKYSNTAPFKIVATRGCILPDFHP